MTNKTHKIVLSIYLLIPILTMNKCSALNSQSSSSRRDIVAVSMNIMNLFPDEDVQKPKKILEPPIIETLFEKPDVKPGSLRPKIIVLGSTGRIGRLIIRKLMAVPDATVVAFARDYDKACEVLYDELTDQNSQINLQLKVMDLVPKQFVAGYKPSDEEDDDDEEFAVSASRFYQNDIAEYGLRSTKHDEIDLNPYLKLQDAMKNATAVISTVGTVRTTVPFADYIFKPWRIFTSPEKWCKDKKHPYYVNYMFHKKLLEYAEEEQRRRNKIWRSWEASRSVDDSADEESMKKVDKLRIIRISDLCLAAPAWNFVTVMTNICRSLVFRYQEKCEKLLLSSNLVDVIILRPGDLIDDVRNETSVSIRVDIDGSLPLPVEVGRDDVASLSCLAALSDLDTNYNTKPIDRQKKIQSSRSQRLREQRKNQMTSKKWTIGVGWTNDKHLGYKNVEYCMEAIVRKEDKRTKGERRKHAIRNSRPLFRLLMNPIQSRVKRFKQQSVKPYGVFVMLPMILCVYPVFASILYSLSAKIPFLQKVTLWALGMSQPLIQYLKDAIVIGSNNMLHDVHVKRTVAKKLLIE